MSTSSVFAVYRPGWSLLFMEGYDDDEPYCLVVDPGQATHYGGVREHAVDDGRLRLMLTDEAAQTLSMPA